jgi:hypothetical protein
MQVDRISRLLASMLRHTLERFGASSRAARAADIQQVLRSVEAMRSRLARLNIDEVEAVRSKLESGWEEELAKQHSAKAAGRTTGTRTSVRDQLISQEVIIPTRLWESEYVSGNPSERHPDNHFFEGVSSSGTPMYSSADHLARAFEPTTEDRELALLIIRQAKSVAPELFEEEQVSSTDRREQILQVACRSFGLLLIFLCALLAFSY